MAGFFKGIGAAIKSGQRAGRIVKIVQQVVGRPLSAAESEVVKEFHDRMNFSENLSDGKIALDYFYFLLNGENHPSGMPAPSMSAESKEGLIEVIHGALGWGTLPLGDGMNSTEDIQTHVRLLRRHAGLD